MLGSPQVIHPLVGFNETDLQRRRSEERAGVKPCEFWHAPAHQPVRQPPRLPPAPVPHPSSVPQCVSGWLAIRLSLAASGPGEHSIDHCWEVVGVLRGRAVKVTKCCAWLSYRNSVNRFRPVLQVAWFCERKARDDRGCRLLLFSSQQQRLRRRSVLCSEKA